MEVQLVTTRTRPLLPLDTAAAAGSRLGKMTFRLVVPCRMEWTWVHAHRTNGLAPLPKLTDLPGPKATPPCGLIPRTKHPKELRLITWVTPLVLLGATLLIPFSLRETLWVAFITLLTRLLVLIIAFLWSPTPFLGSLITLQEKRIRFPLNLKFNPLNRTDNIRKRQPRLPFIIQTTPPTGQLLKCNPVALTLRATQMEALLVWSSSPLLRLLPARLVYMELLLWWQKTFPLSFLSIPFPFLRQARDLQQTPLKLMFTTPHALLNLVHI